MTQAFTLADRAPQQVLRPSSAAELAEVLAAAHAANHAVVPWGGGTRQHLCDPPTRYDLAVSSANMTKLLTYHPEDLVVTVEAGITLAALQATLATHGQWLPWDVPLPAQASIGGLLASGAAGAHRLGFGPPRDWTLGMRVVLGDGRLVKSGGQVVKNVAGYDSHKLHIGAFGTLGMIAEVTFKLQPLPAHHESLLALFADEHMPTQAVAQLRAAPLQPSALVVLNHQAEVGIPELHDVVANRPAHFVVLAGFRGSEAAVQRQIREATQRCLDAGAVMIDLHHGNDQALWQAIANMTAPAHDGSLLLRAAVPSAEIGPIADMLETLATQAGWPPAHIGVAGPGIVFSRWPVATHDPNQVVAVLHDARTRLAASGGYLVVEEVPADMSCDRWGPAPEGIALMRTLRHQWDARHTLNPGRFLV